jgi:subtilisin family serine protease
VNQAVAAEPLADLQWGMEMIGATAEGSYAVETGNPDVLVGIIDTGIDSTHPDLDDNFNAELSHNFDGHPAGRRAVQPSHHSARTRRTWTRGCWDTRRRIGRGVEQPGVAGVAPAMSLSACGPPGLARLPVRDHSRYVYAADNGSTS